MPVQPSNRSLVFPIFMVVLGLSLIIGSVLWMLNNRSARNLAWVGPDTAAPGPIVNAPQSLPTGSVSGATLLPQPTVARRIPYPHIPRVGLTEAKAAFDLKQAIFVDARGEEQFLAGHIPGAILLTEEELPTRMGELDKNAWIITYCT